MRKKIITFLLIVFGFLTCLIPKFANRVAYASSINIVGAYTNVLDDLRQDNDFNVDNYPVIENDYSLQLMTIAESETNELYVYVYQPSGENVDLMATSISISRKARNEDRSYINYKLSYLNSSGVFYKYLVLGFEISPDTTRYYEISSIYRAWDSQYDETSGNDNTISEVAFKVGKQFVAENGELEVYDFETIQVTSKYVGFVRYDGGYDFFGAGNSCDSHFVAFSTNKQIDKLMEVDVYFKAQWALYQEASLSTSYGEIEEKYSYLKHSDLFVYNDEYHDNDPTYTRFRIQTIDEFIQTESIENVYDNGLISVNHSSELTEECLSDLQSCQWLVRFYESNYTFSYPSHDYAISYTNVTDVSILRLKFETDGVVYNLGVVDNKQSGDNVPDNITTTNSDFTTLFKLILTLVFIVVIVAVIIAVFPNALPVIGKILSALLKSVVVVISLPFKAIGLIKETIEEEKKKYNNKKKGNKKK